MSIVDQHTKDSVARLIADAHRAVEPAIAGIYRIESPGHEEDPGEPIKLLEVNPNTPASGIMPVGLSAHPANGIVFPSIVVEIHPTEFEQLKQGVITLPNGWVWHVEL